MLQVFGLGCERDRRQLFGDVSFSLNGGELLQVLGANGSGKSTLLRILAGIYTDFEGEVARDLDNPPVYFGHKAGVKSQLTVRENLEWILAMRRTHASVKRIEEVLAHLALAGFEDTPCGQLSEGQKKRVGLARFFLCADPFWIMDEPFSAIDRAGLAALKALMTEHVLAGGAVIFSTHQKVDFDHPLKSLEL
ncbi:MAG: heme exporter protein A [Candidatus Azotimanducaceae bacterium]|jgi:heme exporter protein A